MRSKVLIAWTVVLLVACGGSQAGPGDLGTFRQGEGVTFQITDTVNVCNDEMPYRIIQVTDGGERRLLLAHSCVGIMGEGIDQFCENGQVETVLVNTCSDAIVCEDEKIDTTVTWDQHEYVEIEEECGGQTIRREVKQQVPSGSYQIVVQDWVDDRIETRVIGEFQITE